MASAEPIETAVEGHILEEDNFVENLSDAGKFSYLALCSSALSLLYGTTDDKWVAMAYVNLGLPLVKTKVHQL